jgi:hypothetical protein
LAGLAGAGFGWIVLGWEKLSARWSRPVVSRVGLIALVLLAFGSQLVTMVRLYPHYLSYYGESVGGLAGATRMKLETTYWCETYSLALPILNDQAKPDARIWVDPWSHDVMIYYQTQGNLRKDLKIMVPYYTPSVLGPDAPSPEDLPMSLGDWYVFEHRQTMLGPEVEDSPILKLLKRKEMVYEYSFDGVPIFTLYKSK